MHTKVKQWGKIDKNLNKTFHLVNTIINEDKWNIEKIL